MNTASTKHQSKNILLSKKGMKDLQKSISDLEHDRHQVIKSLKELNKTNGHDDRFERNDLLLRLEIAEAELHDKKQVLAHAKLLPSRKARIKVAVGSVVDLIDERGRLFRYTIVESIEANPSDGRISDASPLGSNLIGKTVHDIVEWGQGLQRNSLRLVRIA